MFCNDPKVMGSNPGHVECGVNSPGWTLTKMINVIHLCMYLIKLFYK